MARLRSHDASPQAWEARLASCRAMTGAQRLPLAAEMSDDLKVLARAGVAHRLASGAT
ncbi:MAG: hypothetical protein ACT4OS_04660 [Acidimicrobiales bacterium]